MSSSRNLQVRHVYRRPIRNTVMPSRTTSLIPPSSVPSSVPVSTSVSFSAPPSSYVSFSVPIPISPVTAPNLCSPYSTSTSSYYSCFPQRWPQPMNLDPSDIILDGPTGNGNIRTKESYCFCSKKKVVYYI